MQLFGESASAKIETFAESASRQSWPVTVQSWSCSMWSNQFAKHRTQSRVADAVEFPNFDMKTQYFTFLLFVTLNTYILSHFKKDISFFSFFLQIHKEDWIVNCLRMKSRINDVSQYWYRNWGTLVSGAGGWAVPVVGVTCVSTLPSMSTSINLLLLVPASNTSHFLYSLEVGRNFELVN